MKPVLERITVRTSEDTIVNIRLRLIDECAGTVGEILSLSGSDKAEIVRSTLEDVLTGTPAFAPNKSFVLSNKNIEPLVILKVSGYTGLLMTPAELQAKADRQGDFTYLQFDRITVRGACVGVTLTSMWADGTSSIDVEPRNSFGESRSYYIFRRVAGKWVGKVISGWVS